MKKTLEEVQEYIKTKINKCLLFNERLAFCNFEEMVFSPIGLRKMKRLTLVGILIVSNLDHCLH